DASSQLAFVIERVEAKLAHAAREKGGPQDAWIALEGQKVESFEGLVEALLARGPAGDGGRLRAAAGRLAAPRRPSRPGRRRGQARRSPARLAALADDRDRHPCAPRPGERLGGRGRAKPGCGGE